MFLSLEGRMLAADENPRQVSSHRIDPTGPGDSQILADSTDIFILPVRIGVQARPIRAKVFFCLNLMAR